MAFKSVQLLTLFPQFGQFRQVVTLGTRRWTLAFTWRERLRAWFCDVYDDEGEAVVTGRRLSPNSAITFGRLDFPGQLTTVGDDTERRNLGRTLHVAYMEFE